MTERSKDLQRWLTTLTDTGCGRDILVGSCCDRSHSFYDHRVREQIPNLSKEEVEETIDSMLRKGIFKGGGFLMVNWDNWYEEWKSWEKK